MLLSDRVGEIRVDADFLHVRHDQERRVAERVGVLLELRVGLDEIAAVALVFPDEAAVPPDIGEPLRVADLARRFLEFIIGTAGFIDTQQIAKFEEMMLRGGALGAGVAAPPGNEFFGRHCRRCGLVPWVRF